MPMTAAPEPRRGAAARGARRALRFSGSVAIVSGVLLIADAVATVTWQEPITALIAQRAQAGLRAELATAARRSAADARALRVPGSDPRSQLSALAARHAARARSGRALGRIELPTLGRSYAMVEGTDTEALRKGPGHYADTPLPGQRGTVGVAGHRTTYMAPFRVLDRLRPGHEVVLAMPYGRFVYRVEQTRIVEPTAVWVKRRVRYDRLVLTACHPLYSSARRMVVFARLASGPSSAVTS